MLVMKRRCLRRRCNMPIMPSGSANGSRIPLLANELAYWRARLQDAPLLSTFHRCTRARHNLLLHGSRFSITSDETLSLALKHVARTQETTPFVLMLDCLPTGADALRSATAIGDRHASIGAFARNCRVALVIMPALRLSTPILMG